MSSNNQINQDLLDTIRNIKSRCDADLEECLNKFVFDEPSEGEKRQSENVFHNIILIALIISTLSLSIALTALVVINNTKNHETYRLNKILDLRLSTVNNFKKSSKVYLDGVYDFAQRRGSKPNKYTFDNKHYLLMIEDIKDFESYFYDSDSLKYLKPFKKGQQLFLEKSRTSTKKNISELDSTFRNINSIRDSLIYEANSKIFTDN